MGVNTPFWRTLHSPAVASVLDENSGDGERHSSTPLRGTGRTEAWKWGSQGNIILETPASPGETRAPRCEHCFASEFNVSRLVHTS